MYKYFVLYCGIALVLLMIVVIRQATITPYVRLDIGPSDVFIGAFLLFIPTAIIIKILS